MKNSKKNTAKKSIEKFNNTLDKKQLNAIAGGYAYTANRNPVGGGVIWVVTVDETLL
jgi:hypothetical protein